MKFQLKALVAVAVLAAALPAQAAIQGYGDGTVDATTGNGALLLSVLDRTAGISALFDLGNTYSDFNVTGTSFANSGASAEGVNFSWDVSTGDYSAAWTNFLSLATLPNITYAVITADNTGSGVGRRGFITTFSAPTTGSYLSNQLTTALGGSYLNYTNDNANSSLTTFQNHTTVANGASTAVAGSPYAGNGNNSVFLNNKLGGSGPTVFGAIGADLGVVQVVTGANGFAPTIQTAFGNGAKFNLSANGLLTYSTTAVAAVPEADTWAMMLLGLGFMGFVARRKQA